MVTAHAFGHGSLYVVFERVHTFMFQLRHKNITRIVHSYRKKIIRKSTLEYKLIMTKTRTPTLEHRYVRQQSGGLWYDDRSL
jgi:hypothetical protein